jgi:hypothetical protein
MQSVYRKLGKEAQISFPYNASMGLVANRESCCKEKTSTFEPWAGVRRHKPRLAEQKGQYYWWPEKPRL